MMEDKKSELIELLRETGESDLLNKERIESLATDLHSEIGDGRFSRFVDFYAAEKALINSSLSSMTGVQAIELIRKIYGGYDRYEDVRREFGKIVCTSLFHLESALNKNGYNPSSLSTTVFYTKE